MKRKIKIYAISLLILVVIYCKAYGNIELKVYPLTNGTFSPLSGYCETVYDYSDTLFVKIQLDIYRYARYAGYATIFTVGEIATIEADIYPGILDDKPIMKSLKDKTLQLGGNVFVVTQSFTYSDPGKGWSKFSGRAYRIQDLDGYAPVDFPVLSSLCKHAYGDNEPFSEDKERDILWACKMWIEDRLFRLSSLDSKDMEKEFTEFLTEHSIASDSNGNYIIDNIKIPRDSLRNQHYDHYKHMKEELTSIKKDIEERLAILESKQKEKK